MYLDMYDEPNEIHLYNLYEYMYMYGSLVLVGVLWWIDCHTHQAKPMAADLLKDLPSRNSTHFSQYTQGSFKVSYKVAEETSDHLRVCRMHQYSDTSS